MPVRKVLVVEDNQVNREVARRFFEKLGQRVTMAVDGGQGVSLATGCEFDLILMDMQMPVMDGIEATKAIRSAEASSGHRARIVAMTANASDTDRTLCSEAGTDEFIAKPITLARLAEELRSTSLPLSSPQQQFQPRRTDGFAVDHSRRVELAEALGEDGLKELDESFFADMSSILRDLHAALSRAESSSLDRTLHTIKGAAANLGFTELAAFAEASRRNAATAQIEHGIKLRAEALSQFREQAGAA